MFRLPAFFTVNRHKLLFCGMQAWTRALLASGAAALWALCIAAPAHAQAQQPIEQVEQVEQAEQAAQNASAPEGATEDAKSKGKSESADRQVDPSKNSFNIRIESKNKDIRELVEKFLELKRYQQVPDLDNVELHRLLHVAEVQVRRLLATQGYFSPTIDLLLRKGQATPQMVQQGAQQVSESTTEAITEAAEEGATQETALDTALKTTQETEQATAQSRAVPHASKALPEVVIRIQTGEPTYVRKVDLQVQGAAKDYRPARRQLARARSNWPLPVGEAFTQAAWAQSKTQMLQSLQSERFAAAKLMHSKAAIDANANSADLQLLYESGPVYRYGDVQVQGAERYDAVIARRLARVPKGAEYKQSDLTEAQLRLLSSGYYEGAGVMLDTREGTDPDAAPVRVFVKEMQLQKLVAGVGFSTDNGPGVSLEHTHNRLPMLGWRGVSHLQWNQKKQLASASLLAPPSEDLWQWLLKASYDNEHFSHTRRTTQQMRWGRTKNTGAIERTWYAQYDRSRANYGQTERNAKALSMNYAWTLRRFNSTTFPTRGYGVKLEAGGGYTLHPQQEPFVRGAALYEVFVSLDRRRRPEQSTQSAQSDQTAPGEQGAPSASTAETATPSTTPTNTAARRRGRRNGELVMRAELSGLRTRHNTVIPPNLLFLTGGSSSVRGYGYQQIGISNALGETEPGQYMFAGSVEYRRPVWSKGHATDWDSVVFVDAGNVGNTPADLRNLRYGVGVGAIWRSPVGPIQVALAYGLHDKHVRLHMNLGFSF